MGEWNRYILADYDFALAQPSVVIDIGCGDGLQLAEYVKAGHFAAGVDPNPSRSVRDAGLCVVQAFAEALPFQDSCADAVLVKVTLPYTDDRKAIAEIARVLKPGGRCILVGHGIGYSLRYLLGRDWRFAFYGFRTLVNTALFFATGKRLPGFLGDTIAQTRRRLRVLYRTNRLVLAAETPSPTFLGAPVFLYHDLRKLDRLAE